MLHEVLTFTTLWMSEISADMRKKNSAAPPLGLLWRYGEDEVLCLCGVEWLGLEEWSLL